MMASFFNETLHRYLNPVVQAHEYLLHLRQKTFLGWPIGMKTNNSLGKAILLSWFFRLFALTIEALVVVYFLASFSEEIAFFIPKAWWPSFITEFSEFGPRSFALSIFYFPLSELIRYGLYRIFFAIMAAFSPMTMVQKESLRDLLVASLGYGVFWALPFVGSVVVFFGQMSFLFRGLTVSIRVPMLLLITFFFVPIVFSFVNIMISFFSTLSALLM